MIPPAELERLRRLREDGSLTAEDYELILRQLTEQAAAESGTFDTDSPEPAPAVQYAGFLIRLGALVLDSIIALSFILLLVQAERSDRLASLYLLLPNFGFVLLCNVWLVQRFGGSPGKLLLRIGITRLDGSPVGYREAILRELPGLILSLVLYVGLYWPQWNLTDAGYHALQALPPLDRSQRLATLKPFWYQPVNTVNFVWNISEFVILLTNAKRRGLQDYLAGTVVIHLPPGPSRLPFL